MSIDLTTTKFSLANARELALYARMAYNEPPDFHDPATDTNGLIRDLGDCVVVAYEGTKDLRNFITDAQALRVRTPYGEVHSGFWKAWRGVCDQVVVKLAPFGSKPVIQCGHSLGGDLSMVGAPELCERGIKIHSIYGFGSARDGDAQFQKTYNTTHLPGSPFANLGAATFTVINDCDIVPRIPGLLLKYHRTGLDEFIPEVGDRIIEEPPLWVRLGSDVIALAQGWWGKRSPAFLDELLLDHHIDNYIATLNEIEPRPATLDPEATEVAA